MTKRKSGRQRRRELKAIRKRKRQDQEASEELRAEKRKAELKLHPYAVDVGQLAPDNSYSAPEFLERGYYVDFPFKCKRCGVDQIWTAAQQKWWYEVAKGKRWTTARFCRPCRQHERKRRDEARRVHLDGIAAKEQRKQDK